MVNDPPTEDDEYDHEEDVRQIVAQLGVADFVYNVPVVAQGGVTARSGMLSSSRTGWVPFSR